MHRTNIAIVLSCMLTAPTALAAQDDGAADIEGGVTEAGSVELGVEASAEGSASGAGTSGSSSTGSTSTSSSLQSSGGGSYSASGGSSGGTRLALQLRLDTINVLEVADSLGAFNDDQRGLLVPMATPGVRLLDSRLFIGLGLGLQSWSEDDGPDEQSRSGFSFSPGASYDVIANDMAALSLGGFFNLAFLGETEICNPDCNDLNDDATGVGLTLLAGLRGKLSPALAIGGEFGWGFMSISIDSGADIFVHGITGVLLFEASVGI